MPPSPLNPSPGDSSLRLPAQRRLQLETSQRLSTITESSNPNATPNHLSPPKIPPKSALRASFSTFSSSFRTAPPSYKSYEWVYENPDGTENGHQPVEGEKLAKLRREGDDGRKRGWRRVALVGAVVLLVLGLAVGLGVGLTSGKKRHVDKVSTASQVGGGDDSSSTAQPFPLGEWSFVTALREVTTDCTSNAATWRCYPYSVYDSVNPGDTTSRTTFNWVLSNTSAIFASNSTSQTTSSSGVTANLTISSTTNPFSISFANESLTYFSTSSNTTSPHLTFTFQMSKNVIPSPAITPSGTQSECFFNSTTFTGTIYLDAAKSYPEGEAADDAGIGGYKQWPYAVEVVQSSEGGQSVPTCYETTDGGTRDGIVVGLEPQKQSQECACRYGNF